MSPRHIMGAVIPLVLISVLVWYVTGPGAETISRGTPIPDVTLEMVTFEESEIRITVRNTGPVPIRIVQGDVNDRIQPSAVEPDGYLERLETATVRIPYEWNEGEPYNVGITIHDGTRFDRDIPAASLAIPIDLPRVGLLALAGTYIGIIPVFIGMMWLPFIRRLSSRGLSFFLALTIGLLLFLGIDTLEEALAISSEGISGTLNGGLLIAVAAVSAFMVLQCISGRLGHARGAGFGAALMVSIGIGLHNFGEGLALGAALNLGSLAFSAYLMAGFAIHNTTEGIAIVAPLSSHRRTMRKLVALGAVAGAPAVLGAWTGGFSYSPITTVIFLGVGAGAIFQVILAISRWIIPSWQELSSPPVAAGVMAGMAIMYVTSILV